MVDTLQVGKVQCDYINRTDFRDTCSKWLTVHTIHHVVTLNPEMVMLAEKDELFRSAVQHADIRVPDGSGLIWARWYVRSGFWSLWPSLFAFSFRTVQRVTGVDAVTSLTHLAQEASLPVYLLGGTQTQVLQTHKMLEKKYPGTAIAHSRPHRFDLTGPKDILDDIKTKRPSVLFVAYGAPRQSVWIERHRVLLKRAGVRIAIGVGGAFAILSEERKRAPLLLRRMNLEWLWRLALEPQRLPRIWNAVVRFPLLVHGQKKRHEQQTPSSSPLS